jgi:hypothetical protein
MLAKKAVFKVPMALPGGNPLFDVDWVAFKVPDSGKIWVGWDMDFYVETDSTIIGGMLLPGGNIHWHKDLAEEPAGGDLDAAIEHLQKQINKGGVKGEYDQGTFTEETVSPTFFHIPGTTQLVIPKFKGVGVNGGVMRLDLENPETGKSAGIWIDVKTRLVLKTVQYDP